MRLEIYDGDLIGTATWRGPGDVELDMPDERRRSWFESYFRAEDAYLDGPVEAAEMYAGRRDSSESAFEHAAFRLAAYTFTVKRPAPAAARAGGATR